MRMLKGYHTCDNWNRKDGDWRLLDISNDVLMIPLLDIEHLLTKDRLINIKHNEICWKSMAGWEWMKKGDRYEKCDISVPCIVLVNAPNPKDMKYRLIDGKHRMAKMNDMDITDSQFYVIEYNDIKKYVIEYNDEI